MKKIVTILLCVLIQAGCGYNSNYDLYIHEQDTIHRINRSGDTIISTLELNRYRIFDYTDQNNIAFLDKDTDGNYVLKLFDPTLNTIKDYVLNFENNTELSLYFPVQLRVYEKEQYIAVIMRHSHIDFSYSIVVYDYLNNIVKCTRSFERGVDNADVFISQDGNKIYYTYTSEDYEFDIVEADINNLEDIAIIEKDISTPYIAVKNNIVVFTRNNLLYVTDTKNNTEYKISLNRINRKALIAEPSISNNEDFVLVSCYYQVPSFPFPRYKTKIYLWDYKNNKVKKIYTYKEDKSISSLIYTNGDK